MKALSKILLSGLTAAAKKPTAAEKAAADLAAVKKAAAEDIAAIKKASAAPTLASQVLRSQLRTAG